MRFICAQPATLYYAWQVEVMINNFKDNGINPNSIDIVCWKDGDVPEIWSKLCNNYAARFFFYDDTRESKHYVSSIRPNILKQHFKAHPYLGKDPFLYHDCDIVFTKPIDWYKFMFDENWYGSDTRFYISHDYINSKGEEYVNEMCSIVGIDKQIVKDNELNCIGAQYLIKDIDWTFWETVERDCENLFKDISELNRKKRQENPDFHDLQIWCADMWAVLWGGWKLGRNTICHKDFDFAWATSGIKDWDKYNIYHNAGVVNNSTGLFYKSDYIYKLPYNEDLKINEKFANYKYWNLIQETAKKSVLI